jgi:hypothetical protein
LYRFSGQFYFAFRTIIPLLMCGCCYHHTGPHLCLLSMFHPQASIYGYYTYHKRYSCSCPRSLANSRTAHLYTSSSWVSLMTQLYP